MLLRLKWLAVIAIFTFAVGCSSTGDGGEKGASGGVVDPAVLDSGAGSGSADAGGADSDETVSDGPAAEDAVDADTDVDADGDVGAFPGEIGIAVEVAAGEPKEIETMIEGMAEKVSVTPYTISPFGISFDMRTDMGEPQVEEGSSVKFATQMGDDVAVIELRMLKDTSAKDAVDAMKQEMADNGYTDAAVEVMKSESGLTYNMANYQGDGYYAGFKVFGAGMDSLVVLHSYPFDAGDGMAAVMTEFVNSLKIAE